MGLLTFLLQYNLDIPVADVILMQSWCLSQMVYKIQETISNDRSLNKSGERKRTEFSVPTHTTRSYDFHSKRQLTTLQNEIRNSTKSILYVLQTKAMKKGKLDHFCKGCRISICKVKYGTIFWPWSYYKCSVFWTYENWENVYKACGDIWKYQSVSDCYSK